MKRIHQLLCFCLILSAGCKKEPVLSSSDPNIPYFDFRLHNKGSQEFGAATASVFGKHWEASANIWNADSAGNFMVFFHTYSEFGEPRDKISFGITNGAVGTYSVSNNLFDSIYDDFIVTSSYGIATADGDEIQGIYMPDTSYHNVITISKNDGTTLEGTFSILFTTPGGLHTDIPGKVFFKDGKFNVKMK